MKVCKFYKFACPIFKFKVKNPVANIMNLANFDVFEVKTSFMGGSPDELSEELVM